MHLCIIVLLRKSAARLGEVFFCEQSDLRGSGGRAGKGYVPGGNWVTVGYRFPPGPPSEVHLGRRYRETGIEGSQRKRHWKGCWRCILGGDREIGPEYASVSYSSTPSVALRCGIIVVARIRNFCQYRMWTRMYSSTCICWVPMWGHYGPKD